MPSQGITSSPLFRYNQGRNIKHLEIVMPFQFTPLEIPEVILIETRRFGDDRGFFMETYKQEEFAANGIHGPFVQDNCSHSAQGVVRGLHYQIPPHAQGKLLVVVQGEIFDVAVDIRRHSPTYGQWVGAVLSARNGRMLYIPSGFAHGFCVLSESATLTYKVTDVYMPAYEQGIRWDDPTVGINWPVTDPILSVRDKQLPSLADVENPFVWTDRT
jgi:dTDP-4-dehydrorhamnose 3,5-epimerase